MYVLTIGMLTHPLVSTVPESQFLNNPFHSLFPLFESHVRWQSKCSREVKVLTNGHIAIHHIILIQIKFKQFQKLMNLQSLANNQDSSEPQYESYINVASIAGLPSPHAKLAQLNLTSREN